jgi:hypothetical protein
MTSIIIFVWLNMAHQTRIYASLVQRCSTQTQRHPVLGLFLKRFSATKIVRISGVDQYVWSFYDMESFNVISRIGQNETTVNSGYPYWGACDSLTHFWRMIGSGKAMIHCLSGILKWLRSHCTSHVAATAGWVGRGLGHPPTEDGSCCDLVGKRVPAPVVRSAATCSKVITPVQKNLEKHLKIRNFSVFGKIICKW